MTKKAWVGMILCTVILFLPGCAEEVSSSAPESGGSSGGTDALTTVISTSATSADATTGVSVVQTKPDTTTPIINPKTSTTTKKPQTTTATKPQTTTTKKQTSNAKITIYTIDRDVFCQFIQNPSLAALQKNAVGTNTYPTDDNIFYNKWAVTRYALRDELIALAGDLTAINRFLTQNGFKGNGIASALFCTPNTPITIWVQTKEGDIYITEDGWPEYTYEAYSSADYRKKFGPKEAALLVNGKEIASGGHAKIYYNYADIPMLATMRALGAEVNWLNETTAAIVFSGGEFRLDMKTGWFTMNGFHEHHFMGMPGSGVRLGRSVGEEYVLDSTHAQMILLQMGVKAKIDHENVIIRIE